MNLKLFVPFKLCKEIATIKIFNSHLVLPLFYTSNGVIVENKTDIPVLDIIDIIENLPEGVSMEVSKNTLTNKRIYVCRNGNHRLFSSENAVEALAKELIFLLKQEKK